MLSITMHSFAGVYTFRGAKGDIGTVKDSIVEKDPNWIWVAAIVLCCSKSFLNI